ncbi:MAG TPA: T9SS type A sorting domain-containing protein [Bacteroidia bacterium]|jgi:hypothetical protein|nr:T9SS type A sorting domain-containing protein [Bacteroidia bacterium]
MKKISLLSCMLLLSLCGQATVHIVNIFCTGIVPSSTSATCGDTISFRWSGCQDTVYSGIIPGCATAWNTPMNSTVPVYTVVVPCAGVYNFKNLAVAGTITVTCATDVPVLESPLSRISVYPNPSTGLINLGSAGIPNYMEVFSSNGEKVYEARNATELRLFNLPKGLYLLRVYSGKDCYSRKIVLE